MSIVKTLSIYDIDSGKRMKLIQKLLSPDLFEINENGCHELKRYLNNKGYGIFDFNRNAKDGRQGYLIHRVSYEFFKGRIPTGASVMHLCDNPKCINPNHLVAGSHADNMADMARKKRNARFVGSQNPKAKLTETQVIEIKKLLNEKSITRKAIAEKYKVTTVLISQISLGKIWSHRA